MIYEIRNYHFDPERLEAYKDWARRLAIPYFSARLDVVDFWTACGVETEVRGEALDSLGPATVTWIVRWSSHEARQSKLPEVLGTDTWKQIFAQVPGGASSYRRIECRFFESLIDDASTP